MHSTDRLSKLFTKLRASKWAYVARAWELLPLRLTDDELGLIRADREFFKWHEQVQNAGNIRELRKAITHAIERSELVLGCFVTVEHSADWNWRLKLDTERKIRMPNPGWKINSGLLKKGMTIRLLGTKDEMLVEEVSNGQAIVRVNGKRQQLSASSEVEYKLAPEPEPKSESRPATKKSEGGWQTCDQDTILQPGMLVRRKGLTEELPVVRIKGTEAVVKLPSASLIPIRMHDESVEWRWPESRAKSVTGVSKQQADFRAEREKNKALVDADLTPLDEDEDEDDDQDEDQDQDQEDDLDEEAEQLGAEEDEDPDDDDDSQAEDETETEDDDDDQDNDNDPEADNTNEDEDDLEYTLEQVAERVGVRKQIINGYRRSGSIPNDRYRKEGKRYLYQSSVVQLVRSLLEVPKQGPGRPKKIIETGAQNTIPRPVTPPAAKPVLMKPVRMRDETSPEAEEPSEPQTGYSPPRAVGNPFDNVIDTCQLQINGLRAQIQKLEKMIDLAEELRK